MDHPVRQTIRLAALLLWAAILLWLSLMPAPPSPPTFLSWDKLQHAGAYALLTLLAGWTLAPRFRSRGGGWCCAALFAIVYGGLVEMAQGAFTVSRTAELGDLLANAVGALAVLIAGRLVRVAAKGEGHP